MYINIRILMLKNNLTFDDVAKVLKVSRNSASLKVRGKASMTVEDIKLLKSELFTNSTYEELMQTQG